MWYCDVTGDTLAIRKLKTRMPTWGGFATVPIRIADGKLLAVGTNPESTDITLVHCDEKPQFEKIGDIPGEARRNTSSVLIGDRFVVGFGGRNINRLGDLWVFDLQTRRSSQVRRRGKWHPEDILVSLVVQGGVLYLLAITISCISLTALAALIEDRELRIAFSRQVGPPATPLPRFTAESLCDYSPELL